MDLAMSVEQIRHYKNLLESVLNEARTYDEMFNDIFRAIGDNPNMHRPTIEKIVNKNIREIKKKLRKSDRIVWFLRQWKVGFVSKLIDGLTNPYDKGDQLSFDDPLVVQLNDILKKSMINTKGRGVATDYVGIYARTVDVLTKFEHFLSLPIPQIQNYKFEFQHIDDVYQQFRTWENEWKEKTKSLIPYDPDDGELIIELPNGYFWQNLNREYCRAEGNAMGHCGNTAAYQAGDRVLSLRQLVKVGKSTFVKPSLTFILHSDGFLGEMKGRANEKPNEKYHPYIIELLKLPIIKGIRGGGYAPENNFQMNDLDDVQREQLINIKPQLGTLKDYVKKYGIDDFVIKQILSEFGDIKIPTYEYAIVEEYDNINDLVATFGDRVTKYCLKYVEGEEYFDSSMPSHDAVDRMLDEMPKDVMTRLGSYIVKEYPDVISQWEENNEEEFDPSYHKDILSVLDEYQNEELQELYDTIYNAYRYSEESGTVSEMHDALKEAILETKSGTGDIQIETMFKNSDNSYAFDTPVQMAVSMSDLIEAASNENIRDEIQYSGWFEGYKIEVNEPYYGFSGFDLNAGLDHLFDSYPQLKPSNKEGKKD